MQLVGIEWDEEKNEQNKRDHEGLDFELAQYVFADPQRLERLDRSERNTSGEKRWQTIGMFGKVMFTVYTERGEKSGLYPHGWPIRPKGEVTMGIITSTVRVGQIGLKSAPTREQVKQLKAIAKKPIHYTGDCPASTPEALQEFAAMAVARRRNRRNPSPVIALRVKPDVLAKYKALGRGYTSIMADVLDYAASNPEILTKART